MESWRRRRARYGVNASLDTTNSGCEKPGGQVNLTGSVSGSVDVPLTPLSTGAGGSITTMSNGETTVEGDFDLEPVINFIPLFAFG